MQPAPSLLASMVPSSPQVEAGGKMPSELQGAHGHAWGTCSSGKGPWELRTPQALRALAPRGPTLVLAWRTQVRRDSSKHI